MTERERPSRRDLIEAQRAIFRNQVEDERMGITEETAEHGRLHDEYYDLARRVPVREQRGIWDEALAEYERETEGSSSHLWVAYGRQHDGRWWVRDEQER